MANKKFPSECIERVSPTFLDKLLIWNSETGESDNFVVIQKLYDIFTTLRDIVSVIKTSTEGLVDTYTITYHDGATSTFQVTNGEKGDTGNGIESIAKTSTSGLVDTYTITFTEGNQTTFTVTNGKGISSISKTSTSGITDTYTITYTDGATSSYSVVNGKGITNIEKTSTSGLVDTYTITYNNGSPSSFTVSNGNGITTIAKTGTEGLVDTYTITFSNGATTTFTVTNGAKGDTGNGISSILKTGTSGLVDTYTITFSNGSNTTFTVTNGATPEIKQTTGTSEDDVMSQKAATDNFATFESAFKTLTLGTGGLVTLSPTTSYFTYRLNVLENVVLNIDLHRMIAQVGNARCRLIIDMPVVKTITIAKPILWGGTAPTFAAAGQYVFDIIDIDGSVNPLIWQVASTTKAQPTGVVIYVDGTTADYTVAQINGETATRTTSTWAAPFRYPQNAINAASAGDIIFVKAGTYYPTHLRTTPTSYTDGDHLLRDATFLQKAGVDVYGGFLGTETKTWQRVVDVNGLPANKTIFSGDILREAAIDPAKTIGDRRTDSSKANAAYNVVYANVGSYTYFNGVEVKYGFANSSGSPTNTGSGVYSANTNLVESFCTITGNTATNGGGTNRGTITNCTITGNTATNEGGGTRLSTITNCTITGNTATNEGGGTYAGTITNCTITGNTATNGGGTYAGTITNCTITGNKATSGGGTSEGTITNCTITGNTATNGGGTSASTVTNCTITGNTATNVGGGTSSSTVTNCTITGNTATSGGGGTYAGTITNCTITGNTATNGGGTYAGNVTNCTITGNTATNEGGGTRLSTVTNCTITGNKATSGGGTSEGTITNCTITGNTATNGGGTYAGNVINCTITGNKATSASYTSIISDTFLNNLIFANRNTSNVIVGISNVTASGVKIFRNNAYDTAHPTITGGAGSDIDTATCIQNLTLEQAGIIALSFVGVPATPEQWVELNAYISEAKARPTGVNLLKAAGINSATYPAPTTDITGAARPLTPNSVTIGAYESE